MKLTRQKIINLTNVMSNIVEEKDSLFSAEFKIRLLKNQENFTSEYEKIHIVLRDKLEFIKKGFKKVNNICCKKNKNGKFKKVKNVETTLFNCISYENFELKKEITKKSYNNEINKILQVKENKIIMEELSNFMLEEIEIKIFTYNSNICPDSLGLEFYKALKDFITIDGKEV